MDDNEACFFVVDISKMEFACVGEREDVEIAACAGIVTNASMGENRIKIYLPASVMDLLCVAWKSTDGQEIADLIVG